MGKGIVTILAIVLLVVAGILIFNRDDGDVAREGTNATSTEDLNGIGGPEEGFDPLNSTSTDDMLDSDNEELVPDKG